MSNVLSLLRGKLKRINACVTLTNEDATMPSSVVQDWGGHIAYQVDVYLTLELLAAGFIGTIGSLFLAVFARRFLACIVLIGSTSKIRRLIAFVLMLGYLFEDKTILVAQDKAVSPSTACFGLCVNRILSPTINSSCCIARWQDLRIIVTRIRSKLTLINYHLAVIDQATILATLVHLLYLTAIEAWQGREILVTHIGSKFAHHGWWYISNVNRVGIASHREVPVRVIRTLANSRWLSNSIHTRVGALDHLVLVLQLKYLRLQLPSFVLMVLIGKLKELVALLDWIELTGHLLE